MYCTNPIRITRREGDRVVVGPDGLTYWTVPCGHCLACRIERSKAWAVRMMLESLSHDDNCFVTLTYDDDHVPIVDHLDYVAQLPLTLRPSDMTLFFKRLRRDLGDARIKYYYCGEYGDHTFRPHYHAVIFGIGKEYQSVIQDNWPYGHVDVGSVTLLSCNYVAGYIQKKLYGDVQDEVYGSRVVPFSRMSKGIGKEYIKSHWQELLRDKYIMFRGRRLPLSRYFWKVAVEDSDIDFSKADLSVIRGEMKKYAVEKTSRDMARLGISSDSQKSDFEELLRQNRQRVLEWKEKHLKSRSKI